MLPGIPWKGPLCWRDRLLNVRLSGCLLQSSISRYPVVVKKNLQRCSFHISKAACSKTAHLSVPSLQGGAGYSFCTPPPWQFCRCKTS